VWQLKKIVEIFKHISRGTTISGVTKKQLLDLEIIIPPLKEQDSIVAEIEKQFTRLDAGVAALKRLQANLKRYRASVLKAACEGKLVPTEAELALKEGREYEPASVLLERILKERREKWEKENAGKGKKKYVEPKAPDVSNLPELPEGWCWGTFEQISQRVTVGHVGPMKEEYMPEGIPFLRSQNVRENRFDPEGLLFINTKFHIKLSKSIIYPGDIVVVRSGSVGVSCVIPEILNESNCADLVIIQRPFGVIPQYGSYYMNSLAKRFVEVGKVGVALTHFNTKSVASMPVPIPPLAEQQRIVEEVEKQL
jgi:type I restriction enzyme S subunit